MKETDLFDYQRSEKLHALPALGDQQPSDLLASIRNLQPGQDCGCYCSRYQFLSRMPPITRAQLVNQKDCGRTCCARGHDHAVPGKCLVCPGRGGR